MLASIYLPDTIPFAQSFTAGNVFARRSIGRPWSTPRVRDDFGRASAWRLGEFQVQDRLRGFLFAGATNRARLNLQPNIVIRSGALLSMSRKREHERALFTAFLDLAPEFAGERLDVWQQPEDESDFPDIIARSITGRKIGVELGEWINEDEMQAAKQKERREEAFLEAIGEQGPNPTQHIRFVWLHPKANARIAPAARAAFRDQLFTCIFECDQRWPNERFWKRGHQLLGDELAAYPLLAKYLNAIKLWPADGEKWQHNWIAFPLRVDTFDGETMWKPLREIVAQKIGHYAASSMGFDHLSLIVIYNQAWIYNSPAEMPLHSFDDAAAELRREIGDNHGAFDRVFLYIALEPGRVLRVS